MTTTDFEAALDRLIAAATDHMQTVVGWDERDRVDQIRSDRDKRIAEARAAVVALAPDRARVDALEAVAFDQMPPKTAKDFWELEAKYVDCQLDRDEEFLRADRAERKIAALEAVLTAAQAWYDECTDDSGPLTPAEWELGDALDRLAALDGSAQAEETEHA